MTRTDELIDTLVTDAAPVRRLRPPLVRAALWLAFAALLVALIAAGHGIRPDILPRLRQPALALTVGAALATGILAVVAAFTISVPGRSRWWVALPLPALAVWMTTIGYGCLAGWVNLAPGFHLCDEVRCAALLVLTSVPLGISLAAMLRYAALLRPGAVATCGGLAVAAIVAAVLPLFHDHDASAMILVWNLGTAALITGLAGLSGRRLFGWMAARPGSGRRRTVASGGAVEATTAVACAAEASGVIPGAPRLAAAHIPVLIRVHSRFISRVVRASWAVMV